MYKKKIAITALSLGVLFSTMGCEDKSVDEGVDTSSVTTSDNNVTYPLAKDDFNNTHKINILGKESYKNLYFMSKQFLNSETGEEVNKYYTASDTATFIIKESIRVGWGKPVTLQEVKKYIKDYGIDESVIKDDVVLNDIVKMLQLNKAVVPFFKEYYGEAYNKEKSDMTNIQGIILQGTGTTLSVDTIGSFTEALTKKGGILRDNIDTATDVLLAKDKNILFTEIQLNNISLNSGALIALGLGYNERESLLKLKNFGDNVISMPDIVSLETSSDEVVSEIKDKSLSETPATAIFKVFDKELSSDNEGLVKVSQLVNKDIDNKGLDEVYRNLINYLQKRGLKYDKETKKEVDTYLTYLQELSDDELREMLRKEGKSRKESENLVDVNAMFRLQTGYYFSDMFTYALDVTKDKRNLVDFKQYGEKVDTLK